jgi:hypothetical protein
LTSTPTSRASSRMRTPGPGLVPREPSCTH